MIQNLSGNEKTIAAYSRALGKEIASLALTEDDLRLYFTDGTGLRLADEGQSCCEHRYMQTDDDLSYFVGGTLMGVDLKDCVEMVGGWGDAHEIQFLEVKTSKGVFHVASHNEHNGYYGGFAIRASDL